MKVLAADIGGTKTWLLVAEVAGTRLHPLHEQRYDSQAYPELLPMVEEFLGQAGAGGIGRACFAVAGPVTGARAKVTNLPWTVEAARLAGALGIGAVRLINDFQAVGYGIEGLAPDDLAVLQEGHAEPHGPRVVIGAGTGLGEGVLVWQRDHYEALPSEGGHVDFAPTDALQIELLRHLMARYPHVTYERVVSGPGLVHIYRFLCERAGQPAATPGTGDAAAAISELGLSGRDPLAAQALDLFLAIYGAQTGNLALTCLASGGVYLAGGIAPKLVERLKAGTFLQAFAAKGRMQVLLAAMPVQVIVNPKVGLIGAALVAGRMEPASGLTPAV